MRNLFFICLICLILIPIVAAVDIDPPASIDVYAQININLEKGIWWFDPPDTDLYAVEVFTDDVFAMNVTNGTGYYNTETLGAGPHVFSTRTWDTSGNVNATWVNITTWNCATCDLTCCVPTGPCVPGEGVWCTITPTPTPACEGEWCTVAPTTVPPSGPCVPVNGVWCPIPTTACWGYWCSG